MNVKLNTSYNNCLPVAFGSKRREQDAIKKQKRKENRILTANTKKVVSECTTVALGLTILYFAMKRNFQQNAVENTKKKLIEQAKNQVLPYKINSDLLKPFLQ